MINKEFLRFFDFFGTKCSFYTEQKLKLYTPLGGILSITSFIAGIFIFIYMNMKSFKREDPIIISTSIKEENHIIKFNEEKIWIPWKISNFNKNNFFNHTGILFPIIKYYFKENNTEIKSKILSYKLCNETSMTSELDNILIDSALNELYCIDMEDLFMGGTLSSEIFYYIEFDLYICKNGLYSDNNITNCIPNVQLNNYYLQINFYYPTIQFQQIDYKTPFMIKYYKNIVLLNEYISKNDKLFLQKIVLYDKLGFFDSTTKIYSYWEYNYLSKDCFYRQEEKSKIYSFNIFIDSNTIYYYRSFKNIFIILTQSLPLISLVHNILKLIAKVFKLTSVNRKMTELLFENLTEKTNKNKYNAYVKEIKNKKILRSPNDNSVSNINKTNDENTFVNLTNKDLKIKQNAISYSLFRKKDKDKENKNFNNIIIKRKSGSPEMYHKAFCINEKNNNFGLNSFNFKKFMGKENMSMRQKVPFQKKKRFVANQLFPFRYYFCSIFVKNIDLAKHPFCMSKKYIKVYIFLCQLFDISSYCVLQREFNIVKNSIFDEKKIKLIESEDKINVNSQNFMREINDSIGKHKLNILGQHYKFRRSIESQNSLFKPK